LQKLLLLSILLVMVGVPTFAARDRRAARSLKKTLVAVVFLNVVYLLLLLFVYPRLR
jgi:hypothetical protein